MDRADESAPAPRSCSFCQRSFPAELAGVFTAPDGCTICEACVEFLWQGLSAQRDLDAEEARDQRPAAPIGIPLIVQ
jgi:hypothetical protein